MPLPEWAVTSRAYERAQSPHVVPYFAPRREDGWMAVDSSTGMSVADEGGPISVASPRTGSGPRRVMPRGLVSGVAMVVGAWLLPLLAHVVGLDAFVLVVLLV